MIEVDNFWHLKTFEVVLTDLWRRWDEVIHKQKDVSMHCTENSEINNEMIGINAIDLCSESQTKTSEFQDAEESTKQESQDKMKSKTIPRLESINMPEKYKLMAESEENETAMMCWENLKDSVGKEPREESDNNGKKPWKRRKSQKMKKNMLILHYIQATDKNSLSKNLVETQKTMYQHSTHKNRTTTVSYITNLDDDLQNNGTK